MRQRTIVKVSYEKLATFFAILMVLVLVLLGLFGWKLEESRRALDYYQSVIRSMDAAPSFHQEESALQTDASDLVTDPTQGDADETERLVAELEEMMEVPSDERTGDLGFRWWRARVYTATLDAWTYASALAESKGYEQPLTETSAQKILGSALTAARRESPDRAYLKIKTDLRPRDPGMDQGRER